LTRRGKSIARIVPYREGAAHDLRQQPAFGMWADEQAQSVAEQVRELRKGRSLDL